MGKKDEVFPWVLFTICLLLFGTGQYWSATWLSKWAFLETGLLFAMCLWSARRTSLWHLPLMLYASLSLLRLSVWPQNPYQGEIDAVSVLALQKNALQGILEIVGAMLFFASIKKRFALASLASLSSIWAIGTTGYLTLSLIPSGILSFLGLNTNPNLPDNGMWFGNPSMGASLLACLLPAVWAFASTRLRKRPLRLWIATSWGLTLLAISLTRASVPWGVLGVVTAAVIAARSTRKQLTQVSLAVFGLAGAMILIGQRSLGHDFWDENQRFWIWNMAWDWFQMHAHRAWGFGYSSSQILLPMEQMITGHFRGDYFLWLHNDWLQLLIEGGYVGAAFVLLSLGRLLFVSWSKPALFASLMGFVTLGLFNYPLRMPIHCFCLVLICGLAESYATRRVGMSVSQRLRQAVERIR